MAHGTDVSLKNLRFLSRTHFSVNMDLTCYIEVFFYDKLNRFRLCPSQLCAWLGINHVTIQSVFKALVEKESFLASIVTGCILRLSS